LVGASVCTLHGILWLHVFGHLLNFFTQWRDCRPTALISAV